ncbi:MAG: RNA polymerase sigma factor [Acidimicrobiales bacterium]
MAHERDDADLVLAARAGDAAAFRVLFDRWFDRVWDVAWRIVRDREVAAEVAQDVFLVAWQRMDDLREPAAFGGWLLRTSRNRALNRLERERRTTPVGGAGDPVMAAVPDRDPDPASAVEDRSRDELVWAAAAALGERDASVLDLHLRHGLAPGEIAEALDVAPNLAHQLLFRLRERLGAAIRSWVLWRHGVPRCADLRAALAGAGIAGFGPDAVRAIGRHAADCEACAADRDEVLAPERLFALVPIALAPPLLKAKAAAALEAGGVPPAGPEHAGGPSPGRQIRPGRVLAAVGVAAVVTVALVVALAGRAGDGERATTATVDATGTTGPPVASSVATTTTPTPTGSTAPGTATPDPVSETSTTPSTAPSTTTTATTTASPPVAPPTISGFRVTQLPRACVRRTPGTAIAWQSSGGEAHTLHAPDGAATTVTASGTRTVCPHQAGIWTLTVTGPGGEDTATATV